MVLLSEMTQIKAIRGAREFTSPGDPDALLGLNGNDALWNAASYAYFARGKSPLRLCLTVYQYALIEEQLFVTPRHIGTHSQGGVESRKPVEDQARFLEEYTYLDFEKTEQKVQGQSSQRHYTGDCVCAPVYASCVRIDRCS